MLRLMLFASCVGWRWQAAVQYIDLWISRWSSGFHGSWIMLRMTPSQMSSHGGTNKSSRKVLPRQGYMCKYVSSCYSIACAGLGSFWTRDQARSSSDMIVQVGGGAQLLLLLYSAHLRDSVQSSRLQFRKVTMKEMRIKKGIPCGGGGGRYCHKHTECTRIPGEDNTVSSDCQVLAPPGRSHVDLGREQVIYSICYVNRVGGRILYP